jgi:LacI family transcriptional regulator
MSIRRLARELNLSISTVSRALHDSHEVGPETKQRVREMAIKLNYEANPHASSLRAQKSKTIAVVVPDISNPFFSSAINGIEAIAQEQKYHVLIYLTHEDRNKEVACLKLLENGRVDGLIMSLCADTNTFDHIEEVRNKRLPIVFFDRIYDGANTSTITTNDYEVSYEATGALIESGCKAVLYLQISPSSSIGKHRLKGYQDALRQTSFPLEFHVLTCGNDDMQNQQLITQYLLEHPSIDGIFSSVEKFAFSSYLACQELNLSIPKDIKISSFSNLNTSQLLNPPLTTITQPAMEIGREAAAVLFRKLKADYDDQFSERIVLNSKLIKRASTA